jgi:type VI secretion system protein ImpA
MSPALLEPLLSPLSAESPCGADPAYDPDLLALQGASVRKGEQQYGKTVIAAQEPDWRAVHAQALALAQRTRDLRTAVLLTRSAARVEGLAGAVGGLQLVGGLLDRFWDAVHPQLDAAEGNDPTARVNALASLAHRDAGLADLRAARLTARRGALTVRDIELALGRADPLPGEIVPSEEGVLQGVREEIAASPEVEPLMLAAEASATALSACLVRRLGVARAPDLDALQKLLGRVAEAARRATGAGATRDADAAGAGAAVAAPGTLQTREDVIRLLERACEWIERNEPTNPAPLLIRRSQRLMTKSFVDIIRDLMPEGVPQIEKLAGPRSP